MPPCVRLLVTWNALILVSHVSALGVLNDAKNNSPSCSFQGLVRTYLHDAPVDISTSLPLRTFTQDLAAAALPTSDPNRKSSSLDFSTDQAGSALAILQDSTTRRRLMNIDAPVVFTYVDIQEYAAQYLTELQPQFESICTENEAALRWSVEECATDVVLQMQAYIIAHACRSRDYTPNPLDVDDSTPTCDPRLVIEAGPQRYKEALFGSVSTEGDATSIIRHDTAINEHVPLNSQGITPAAHMVLRQQIWEELIQPNQLSSAWTNYYDDMVEYVAKHHGGMSSHGQQVRIVEVGTCYGGLADRLAGELRGAHVYAVDPFEVNYDSEDMTSSQRNRWFKSWLNASDQKLNEDEAQEAALFSAAWADVLAEKLHERHGCRAHVVPLRSTDASLLFEDLSLDLIFIDGLHTYEGVAADVLAWLPKIKSPGGSLIFNDYGSDAFPGVTRAASEMIRSRNWSSVVYGDFGTPPGVGNVALVI